MCAGVVVGTRFTWLSSPSVSNMKKKRIAHRVEGVKLDTASGYTTNAKPAPETVNKTLCLFVGAVIAQLMCDQSQKGISDTNKNVFSASLKKTHIIF